MNSHVSRLKNMLLLAIAATGAMSDGHVCETRRGVVTIRRVEPRDVVGLRERVLWPGRPEMCLLPEDELSSAIHLAAYAENEEGTLGVLSLFLPASTAGRAQFRKLAVSPPWQGEGLGTALVRSAAAEAESAGCCALYCHARERQAGFYQARGFARVGEAFVKYEGGGSYVEMELPLIGVAVGRGAETADPEADASPK